MRERSGKTESLLVHDDQKRRRASYFEAYPHSPRYASWLRNTVLRVVCLLVLLAVFLAVLGYSKSNNIADVPSLTAIAKGRYEVCASISASTDPHTISCHIRNAKLKLKTLRRSQSRTYRQAREKYVTQYGRSPPPGFYRWFTYAKENKAVIIDDYGQLEKDLEPLRRVSGDVLRERIKYVHDSNPINVNYWTFANGNYTASAEEPEQPARVMRELMTPFLQHLPEFTVLHNWDDLHRVCGGKAMIEDVTSAVVPFHHQSSKDGINQLTRACPSNRLTDSTMSADRPPMDVCKAAESWRGKHSVTLLSGPCYTVAVPVLSAAKVSSFLDVLIPSWAYAAVGYRFGGPRDTLPYRNKWDVLYWRGSTTGVSNSKRNMFGHRQRFVMNLHQLKIKAEELESGPANATRIPMPSMPTEFTEAQMTALSRLGPDIFDVNFSHIPDETPESEAVAWQRILPLGKTQPPQHSFQHKFVFDLDGNAMSGRFYYLMESNSVVFKQTIFAEYHDDRLIPWIHYVPVSLEMTELPMLLDYFLHDPQGIKHGELIAAESRKWVDENMRVVDMSIHIYRTLLELGDLLREK